MRIVSEPLGSISELDSDAHIPREPIDYIFEINLAEVEGGLSPIDIELLKDEVWSHLREHVIPKAESSPHTEPFRLHILVTGVPEQFQDAIRNEVAFEAIEGSPLISPEYTSVDVIGAKSTRSDGDA